MADDITIVVGADTSRYDSAMKKVKGSLVDTLHTYDRLSKSFSTLDRMFNTGAIDAQQYSKAVEDLNNTEKRLAASIGKTVTAVKQETVAVKTETAVVKQSTSAKTAAAIAAKQLADRQRLAGKSTNRFGANVQQVGYQVGDFFVQVQSGADALVAFGQQGTQLAGLLPGLGGAIIGIGLSLSTAFGVANLKAKGLTINFKQIGKDLKKALSPIQPVLDSVSSALSKVGSVAKTVFNLILANLDRVVVYMGVFASLMATKVVYGFIKSGAAARAFFGIIRVGLISTGIGILVVGIGEVALAFMKGGDVVGRFFEFTKKVFKLLGNVVKTFTHAFRSDWNKLKSTFYDWFKDVLIGHEDTFNTIGKFIEATAAGVQAVWNNLAEKLSEPAALIQNVFVGAFDMIVNGAVDAVNKTTASFEKLANFFGKEKVEEYFGIDLGLPTLEKINFDSWYATYASGAESVADAFTKAFNKAMSSPLKIGIGSSMIDSLKNLSNDAAFKSKMQQALAKIYGGRVNITFKELWEGLKGEGLDSDIDLSKWFTADVGDGDTTFASLLKELQDETAQREKLIGTYGSQRIALEQIYDMEVELERKLTETEKLKVKMAADELWRVQQQEQLVESFSDKMETALMSIVDGSATVEDAFKSMLRGILLEIYQQQVAKPVASFFGNMLFGGANANGNAFLGGNVVPFANGGVVGSPTFFPMANGMGLMGEAGPEAIMPLKRGPDGKLGVSGGGQTVINQTINVSTGVQQTVRNEIKTLMPQIAEQSKNAVLDAKRRGGSYGKRFA